MRRNDDIEERLIFRRPVLSGPLFLLVTCSMENRGALSMARRQKLIAQKLSIKMSPQRNVVKEMHQQTLEAAREASPERIAFKT
jgi:hypothetical protein